MDTQHGTRWRTLALALIVTLGACDDPEGPRVGDALEISAARTHLVQGESLDLRVIDADGQDVTSSAVWTTDDPTTLAVDDGLITGVAPGFAEVAASVGGEVARARFNVRVGDLAAGDMVLRMQATAADPLRFSGFSFLVDWMGDPATATDEQRDYTILHAQASGASDPLIPDSIGEPTDTVFRVSFPGRPVAGFQHMPSWELVEQEDGTFHMEGTTGAMLQVLETGTPGQQELWVPVNGFDLELDHVEIPTQAGFPTGTIRGRASFEAAGLLVEVGEDGMRAIDQIGTETVRIYIEFETAIRIWPRGGANLEVTGAVTSSGWVSAWGEPYRGGLLFGTQRYRGQGTPLTITQVWLGSPGAGVFPLDEIQPAVLADSLSYTADAVWSWISSDVNIDASFQALGDITGLSRTGTVSITEYVAATDEIFGLARGEIDATYTVFGPDGVTGQEIVVRGSFNLPVAPVVWQQGTVVPPHQIRNPGAPSQPPAPTAPGMIQGRVVVDDVTTLAGVRVSLTRENEQIVTETGYAGHYYFPNVSPGEWTLDVELPEDLIPAEGQRLPLQVTLPPADTLSYPIHLGPADSTGLLLVSVRADSGALVADVQVRVYAAGTETLVAEAVTTGELGAYQGRIPIRLAPGIYEVRVVVPEGYEVMPGSSATIPYVRIMRGHAYSTGVGIRAL